MAGFSRIYCIGPGGGVTGGDGVSPILAQICMGESDRMWFEARYFDERFGPMGKLQSVIPPRPDRDDNLLDACLAFFPAAFEKCPSYGAVLEELGDAQHLDFHLDPDGVPSLWAKLREEAREEFAQLGLWQADIEPLERP
jgi:hypothetical protein